MQAVSTESRPAALSCAKSRPVVDGARSPVGEQDCLAVGAVLSELLSSEKVAGVITGLKWSGPLFFGLRKRAKTGAEGERDAA